METQELYFMYVDAYTRAMMGSPLEIQEDDVSEVHAAQVLGTFHGKTHVAPIGVAALMSAVRTMAGLKVG